MRADPTKSTITEIATEFGFWELGRFSLEYRRLFGESPSTTLRQAPKNVEKSSTDPFASAGAEYA
jgi:AraC-like DNA-binding protein